MKKSEALRILNETALREIGTGDPESLKILQTMLANLGEGDFYLDSALRNEVEGEFTKNILLHNDGSNPHYKAAKVIVDFLTEIDRQEQIYERNMKRMEKLLTMVNEEVRSSPDSGGISR